jgi:hypothetical protein
MSRTNFNELPEDSRVWIFAAERPLIASERDQLLIEVDRFIDQWNAHDHPLRAGREIRYDHFLFVAVDQNKSEPSGCSIDALVRQMKALEKELGIELVNHAPIMFRRGKTIERVPREQFARLVATGEVSPETTVFDNSLTRLGEVRKGRWETRAAESWHSQAFF